MPCKYDGNGMPMEGTVWTVPNERKTPMSWKPEVIADSSGKWVGNALRFATKAEAEANVRDLELRWFSVRKTRVVESEDPVSHAYVDGRLLDAAPEDEVEAEIAFESLA